MLSHPGGSSTVPSYLILKKLVEDLQAVWSACVVSFVEPIASIQSIHQYVFGKARL